MRQKGYLFSTLAAAALLLGCCSGIQRGGMGKINATVRFETGLERTGSKELLSLGNTSPILPAGGWTPLKFVLSGSGPNGASFSQEAQSGVFSQECASGEWVLNATVISEDNKELARGECVSVLQPGKTINAEIVLYPLEGNGSLSVEINKNIDMPAGARLIGTLRFKGLPGRPSPADPQSIPIDLPASEGQLDFPELGAGYYLLSLELKTADGFVSGGCAAVALILAGYSSSGICEIKMGTPIADIELELYPKEPLEQALLSVAHSVPRGERALPMAVSGLNVEPGDTITRTWYLNGSEAGLAVQILDGPALLPPNCFLYPPAGMEYEASVNRVDFTEESETSHRFGISSLLLDTCNPVDASPWKAMAVYDYRAAMGPSLCPGGVENNGSGTLEEARCAAASESGLIVVSDFDADKYLHAFIAAYGSALDDTGSAEMQIVPSSASWLRLWRSRIRAGDLKSADRLALSHDGRFIAAAATGAGWIWLCRLGENGEIVTTSFLTSSSSGDLGSFGSVKALCFSPSGDRLYAACSSSGYDGVFAFSTCAGVLEYLYSNDLNSGKNADFTLSDMIITASGQLAISAPEASEVFILQDGASLGTLYCLDNSEANPGLNKPKALALSSQGDSFYALCNEDSIVRFSRPDPVSPYVQDSLISLSPESEGAALLAVGDTGSVSCETILAGGGDYLEFIDIAGDGSKINSQLVHPEAGDPLGLADPSSISFCRGAFLVAGGSMGKITVFGNTL